MPREMGELRRLCLEWNSLVPLALERGIRARTRRHFHMDRVVARQRVADLRSQVAPFYSPNVSADLGTDTFGVELECYLPEAYTYERLAEEIRAEGVMCYSEIYAHQTRTHWKLVRDGSLNGRNGVEVVSPPLSGEEGLEALRKVCRVLTRIGCKVKKDCGLHVHVGCRHRQVEFFKSLVRMYRHFEQAIDSFLAPSRRGRVNPFCQPNNVNYAALAAATNVRAVGIAAGQTYFDMTRGASRYHKLNLMSFVPYGTVEFRQHQGTVEARKAEMWVRLCLRMAAAAAATPMDQAAVLAPTFEGLATLTGMSQVERDYFNERREWFAAREQRRAA